MSADSTAKAKPALPPAQPDDLLAEGARARKLSTTVDGVKSLVEGMRLVNDTILTQVLFALWDSGFYEFSLTHPRFGVQEAADELHLDATLLRWVLDYLVSRGIAQATEGQIGLTEHGTRLSNLLFRGIMNLYVGGWGPQLAHIGPLLRKEITQVEYREYRSGRHTVMGTEQLCSVRTTPAILKVLAQKKLRGVLHLACRTGQFLIELARSEPTVYGIGVDKAPERIAAAQASTLRHGLSSRLEFVTAEVGAGQLPFDQESRSKIEIVVALYLLHEVARHGRQRVVELLRQLQEMFPGKLFLFMETLPADTAAPGKKPPPTFTPFDYLLIHRLRGQGLPLLPAEWKALLEDAGIKLLEVQEVYGSGLYLAEL